ncbi:type IV inositol polyphosphate 5-phosphatase 3-like [Olea europaea var. sylvestris]|uniref:type IV inositol polyphosphate 5-phosphatase 3-like n=1 Tax=Olea europaea var. sylvestris TaxID=158386 RepID=UPI000C1D110A|nr:type IV inositol polyphosphate 5-phosphatase 3-like [Olea europaea var. sylvestris]
MQLPGFCWMLTGVCFSQNNPYQNLVLNSPPPPLSQLYQASATMLVGACIGGPQSWVPPPSSKNSSENCTVAVFEDEPAGFDSMCLWMIGDHRKGRLNVYNSLEYGFEVGESEVRLVVVESDRSGGRKHRTTRSRADSLLHLYMKRSCNNQFEGIPIKAYIDQIKQGDISLKKVYRCVLLILFYFKNIGKVNVQLILVVQGSISVSMSIYQTLFCFICTHLTSGEKDANVAKRIIDVQEIHRRTHFNSLSSFGLPKSIHDHEKIIWLGDLNYRINLSYEKTRELILKEDWAKLGEHDQLIRELTKGRAFYGWSEGTLNFAPTYKYQTNSDTYCGEDSRTGRRTPAWCDRILSFGKGMKLLSYTRSELRLSNRRPVTASFMVEVEIFSPRKLQRALIFTDAEIAEEDIELDGNWS